MSSLLDSTDIDSLAEHVVKQLLLPGSSPRAVVRDLVILMEQQFPGAPALSPVLVLAIVAQGFDELFDENAPNVPPSIDLWRMATLVATDVLALENDGSPVKRIKSLLDYWLKDDDFFLR